MRFRKKSYIKCKNLHNVDKLGLINKIGSIDMTEFIYIVSKINGYNC